MIFVFGSNDAGYHLGGAARVALEQYGAVMGQGEGLYGQSYALPTMDRLLNPLSIEGVGASVEHLIEFADIRPDLTFRVTRVGCGIAGFEDADIAPLFADAPANCQFDRAWEPWLPGRTFWGTYAPAVPSF